MEQPGSIELRSGPDRRYFVAATLLWLLALVNILSYASVLAWPWLALAFLLLAMLHPWFGYSRAAAGHLRLYRDGSATSNHWRGRWRGRSWSSRWATVVRLEAHPGGEPVPAARILICAARNSPRDYHHLLVWNRFPPYGTGSDAVGARRSSEAGT